MTCIDIAKKHNLHVHLYTDNSIISEELLYLDLRNYKLQRSSKNKDSMDFKIVDDIKEYLLSHNVKVCQLVISSTSSTKDIKAEILSVLDVNTTTIQKFGTYKDSIIDKEYEYLDVLPKNVNKDTALQFLGNYLNINPDEMLTIGDNLNAGIGVAVANAYDELKQVANYTTTNPVEKGGFAEAVYKFVKF